MPRETVSFTANVPVEVSLAYPQGKIVQGQFGDRVMYGLQFPPESVMFLDMGVSQKINLLEVKPGERFVICKRPKNGSVPMHWDVWLTPASENARADRELAHACPTWPSPIQPPEPPSLIERQLAASIAEVQNRKAPQSAPGPVAVPAAPTTQGRLVDAANALVDAYATVLERALSTYGGRVKPDEVRSILLSVYIQQTRGGTSHAA